MSEKKIHYAWIILIGVILIRGFSGGCINMTSGLFLAPVSNEIGVGIGRLSIYFSITSAVMVFWFPIAGKLMNRYDVRVMALIGALLHTLSFAAFGFMKNVYGWYLLSIPSAMGAALTVNLLGPILINRWFIKNPGTMIGIQMAFVGIFAAIFQPIASFIITENGWRYAYITIGLLAFFMASLSSVFLLRNSPQSVNLNPLGYKKNNADASCKAKEIDIDEATAVKSASFYLLLFFMIAITGVGVFTQHIPTFGAEKGYSVEETGIVLSLASIGTTFGSVIIGYICDSFGSLKTCYGIILTGIISVFGFLFFAGNYLIFLISAFIFGFTTSGIAVLSPILTKTFFGDSDYEKIYSKVAMGAPISSIILIPAYGFMFDLFKNYSAVLIIMIVLLLISALCINIGWKKRYKSSGCSACK